MSSNKAKLNGWARRGWSRVKFPWEKREANKRTRRELKRRAEEETLTITLHLPMLTAADIDRLVQANYRRRGWPS